MAIEGPKNEIMVTIRCITYNHEPYIRQCLEGFIMQKTNFHFEAIVHDDASTDGTMAIIQEYAEKYPEIIKPIFETENQYSKHDGSLWRVMNGATKGKYVAFCEGDDYWIDPFKLQKQVDFLESNPNCSMVHSDFYIYNQRIGRFSEHIGTDTVTVSSENILLSYRIQTVTVMAKADLLQNLALSEPYLFCGNLFMMGDVSLFFLLSLHGEIGKIDNKTSVYRIVANSASHKKNIKDKYRFALSSMELRMYLAKKYNLSQKFKYIVTRSYNKRLLLYLCFSPSYIPIFPFEEWNIFGKILNYCIKDFRCKQIDIKNI